MPAAPPTHLIPCRVRFRAGGVVVLVACMLGTPAAQEAPGGYALKAAFVYQFPQFVDWPADAWTDAQQFEICVAAPNPFAGELERLVKGESLHGRPLAVRVVNPGAAVSSCHLLFIGAQAQESFGAVLREQGTRAMLTVGEAPAFLDDGGMILLKIVDRRVRFEVHLSHARRARLRISSQLLALAQAVRGGVP
jgi:hypothetical protein